MEYSKQYQDFHDRITYYFHSTSAPDGEYGGALTVQVLKMAGKEFNVLYTHQKRKKAKVWQDGILRVNDQGTKAALLGEGNKRLDQIHMKANQAAVGEELESEKYLITIEEVISTDKPVAEAAYHEKCPANLPDHRPDTQAIGRLPLKRKRSGFVPPRQINKKQSPEKENPPHALDIQQLSTSSEFGSSRSSLFSTPCNKQALQQGPNILNMYGRSTVDGSQTNPANASQSNAPCTASQRQHGMRNTTSSEPHQQKNDWDLESQEWSDDYNGTLSGGNPAPLGRHLAHPQSVTFMDADVDQQQEGHQPGKSTEMRDTQDNLQGGRGLSRTDALSLNRFSLSAECASLNQKLLMTTSEQDGYNKHTVMSANLVNAGTNAVTVETRLKEKLWRTSSEQDRYRDCTDQSGSSVNAGTNSGALETRLTEDVNDHSDNVQGAKRSTSRILALLGKGRKPFQPPLKQETTQVTDMVSHSSTGLTEDLSSRAILRPHRPLHAHQNKYQAIISSSEPAMVIKDAFDEPPSLNTESLKPDMSIESDMDLSGRTAASVRTSQHQSIPSENDLTRLNNTSDQATEGSPREGTVCPETRFYQESPAPRQNQDMRLGVNKRTGTLGTDTEVTKKHEVDRHSEIKKDQCKECQGSRCTCKLSSSYHEEELCLNVTSCESNRMILNRLTADLGVVAYSPPERVDEHSIVQGEEDEGNSQNHAISDIDNSEGLGTASACKTDRNPDQIQGDEELKLVADIDSQEVKSSAPEISPHFIETEVFHNEPDAPQHSDGNSYAACEEAHKRHKSLDLSQNERATLQNMEQENLKDDSSVESHSSCMESCLQIDIVPVDVCSDTSCLQDRSENKTDVWQSSLNLVVLSDLHVGEDEGKPQWDDAQQTTGMHSVDVDDKGMDSSNEHVGCNNTTDVFQKSQSLAAASDLHDDGDKSMRDDALDLMHSNTTFGADVASLILSYEEDESKNRIDVCQKSPRFEVGSDVGDTREKDADHSMDHVDVDTGGGSLISSCEQPGFKDANDVFQRSPSQETDSDPIDGEENYMSKDVQLSINPVDISLDISCEHDGSKGTSDVFQRSSSQEGDSDSIGGEENYLSTDVQLSTNPVDISSETNCEHDRSKGTKAVFQRFQSIVAGSDPFDHGESLVRDNAQNSIQLNLNLHRSNSELSEKSQEYQMEEHIRKLEMAHHEASSCLTSHNVEPMLPDGDSQQSSATSIDTLDFSQDTQQNKDTTLYLQDIEKGHLFKGSTDHSPVPTCTGNVDAVVPDMDYIKTQHLPESPCGGCDITEHFLSKEASSLFDPINMSMAEGSEHSVPEISGSEQCIEVAASEQEECDQVHIGGKVSGEGFLSEQCTTPAQMVGLSAQASEWFGKEVDGNCDGDNAPLSWSAKEDHERVRTTRDEPYLRLSPLSSNLIKDQSKTDMALYDHGQNYRECFQIPPSMHPNPAEGITLLRQISDGHDLEQSTSCSWNATPGNSIMQPQLRSPTTMSSHGSQQKTWSPVFQLPHPEELCNYAPSATQKDLSNNLDVRFQDKHSSIPSSSVLPHPSYLKTSVRRNASNKQDSLVCEAQGDSPKDGIYWKQFVSSGRVRRHPPTPTQSMFQPRQDLGNIQGMLSSDASRRSPYDTPTGRIDGPAPPFDNFVRSHPKTPSQKEFQLTQDWGNFQGIVPSEASRMQPYDTPLQRSARPALPFDNSIRTYPQTPFQTELQPRNDWSTPLQTQPLHADRIRAYSTPASGMIRSEAPFENLFSPVQKSSYDPIVEHCIASLPTTEGLGHSSKTSISSVRDNQWMHVLSRGTFLEGGPSCNVTNMRGSEIRVHQTYSPVVIDSSDSQTGQNSHRFTVDARLQDVLPTSQANEYKSRSPTLPKSQSPCDFFRVNDSQSYLSQGNERCRNQLSQSQTPRSLLCVREPADVALPEPDVMNLYSTRRGESCRDAVLEGEKYDGSSSYQRESSFDMYNMQTHGEDAMSTGQFKNQSHGYELVGTDEQHLGVSQSVSDRPAPISGMDTYNLLEAGNRHHGCYDDTHSVSHNSVYGDCSNAEDLSSRSSPKLLSDDGLHVDGHSQQFQSGDQTSSYVIGSNMIEQPEFVMNMERAQTPDLFTTQQDGSVNDCNSPGGSPKGHTRSPECISISPGPLSMDQPGIRTDAVDMERRDALEQQCTHSDYSTSANLTRTFHSGERKMTFKHRPLISKPSDEPNTPLPNIFRREVVEEKRVPAVTESPCGDRLQFENSQIYNTNTNVSHEFKESTVPSVIDPLRSNPLQNSQNYEANTYGLHEVPGNIEGHADNCSLQVDMSNVDIKDHDSETIFYIDSDGECPSPSHKLQDEFRHDGNHATSSHNVCFDQHSPRNANIGECEHVEFRQDGSQAVCSHDICLGQRPHREANINDCEQGNMKQLHQERDDFHDCSHIHPIMDLCHQRKEVGLDPHCGTQRECEHVSDLKLVHVGRPQRQLTQEVHEYETGIVDIITDDALISGFHDNQVPSQEQENDAGQTSNLFRVGTSQYSLDMGQIDLQGNIRRNTPSLHHLHNAHQHRGQGGMGKSGSQTQLGDTLTRGTGGRERRDARKGFRTPVSSMSSIGLRGELNFPAADTVHSGSIPRREIMIPVSFPSVTSYKQIMTEAVKEHLNILLHELSHRYHSTLEKADITSYTKAHRGGGDAPQMTGGGGNPPCKHGQPAKMVCVKKDGPNKGRMFYACNNQRENQCKFFVWADQLAAQASNNPTQTSQTRSKITLHNAESIEKFARSNQIHLYCESQLSRRGSLNEGLLGSAPAWIKKYRAQQLNNTTKKLYIKLHRKEHSSAYAKDDLWIISQDLTFDPTSSFFAKSMFHGPSSSNEIEIEPLTGYSPSNWSAQDSVYGVLACNASSELTCLGNLQDYVNPRTFPILPHLISCEPDGNPSFNGPAFVKPSRSRHLNLPASQIMELVEDTIRSYHLNPDQSAALEQVASMVAGGDAPVTLIHGVFGAGKSYLLTVMVLLLVKLFQLSEERETGGQEVNGWKVLIASTTNVAVDRILLGLLELGFEDFIRVGSLRKIAKPVLPYSVHASDKENQEMRELQEMLKGDLTLNEKQHVRRSIESQRLGKNKDMLSKVKVIGVTCAACSFPCIKNLTFPVVLLDECSQMMEPSSLLPMARFGCEKLVLVGDPHQLDPTIQGSESAHKSGLEQTLFDRLSLLGYDPIMLRTQYRCHPCISSLANKLFYDGQLLDGVIEEDRPPLLPSLPTLCFFNISHGREMSARDGSYFNDPEASFVVFLISSMMEMGISPADVGVITLYKAQVSRIRMLLQTSSTQNSSELKAIQISTVDAFQGGEKSIIILSCVRTQRVGFIDSDKRTNVALTRSKNHLLIVGGMKMLSDNLLWGEIIHKCQERQDGIQDSKAFQKQWEERLKELKEDANLEEEERPRKKRGKRRKLERKEREHSPAMSLDSNDGDFVSSISPSVSGTTNDCMPIILDMDSSKNTTLHPVGSPYDSAEDDLPCVDLGAQREDKGLSNARTKGDRIESPHAQEVVSLAVPASFLVNKSTSSPHSSAEEEDLPHIDLGSSSKYKDVGSARSMTDSLQSQDDPVGLPKDKGMADAIHRVTDLNKSSNSKEVVSVGESRDSVAQEPMETLDASFSYSPLQNVAESDSEESEEDLPNFDIGDMFL